MFGGAALSGQTPTELRWGGDAEGGAPFVEADPNDPSRVVGFEVDIADLLASGLNRVPRFIQSGFTTLDASVARGDFDIALSGLEDSAARRSRLAVTIPYYQFREILTVRAADAPRYRTLADLRGRRVATLAAKLAFDILTAAQAEHGVVPVPYEDDVHPYSDLAIGRVDAVLLDEVLAERGVRRNPGLTNQATDVCTLCDVPDRRAAPRRPCPLAPAPRGLAQEPRRAREAEREIGSRVHGCSGSRVLRFSGAQVHGCSGSRVLRFSGAPGSQVHPSTREPSTREPKNPSTQAPKNPAPENPAPENRST